MKRKIRGIVRKFGFDIIRFKPEEMGKYPFYDMQRFVKNDSPMIFDVGANEGQTAEDLREVFPKSIINCFEPSPTTYCVLKNKVAKMNKVHAWNCGIGANQSKLTFFENVHSNMSSFLELGESGWGEIKNKLSVDIKSIDQFCLEEKIERIDILKVDTQGFELEVFKGAENTIKENRVGLIFCEVTFTRMYNDLPSFGHIYNFLTERDFSLVSIYPVQYQNNLAGWTDLLFIHKSYNSN